MNNPAAFQATFSDFRIIKGRKVAQIVLEVPLEAADAALEALGGVPRPDREVWTACARLKGSDEGPGANRETVLPTQAAPASPNPPARPPRRWMDIPYPQQTGILCSDPQFCKFVEERDPNLAPEVYVRRFCRVDSRLAIVKGTEAENRWLLLVSAFRAWQDAPRAGAA